MPGIAGGFGVDSKIMASQLCYRDYTSISTIYSEVGQFSVAHHEPAQNSDWAVYSNDDVKAIVWGQPPPTLDASVIQQAMRDPLKLRGLDGSWALAAISGQQILIATDRMASRPVFYSEESPIRVASELKGILPVMSKWSLDILWLMDFLAFAFGWGNRTIVKEIKALPPATALIADKKSYKLYRYAEWLFPTIEKHRDYIPELVHRYTNAVRDTLDRLPDSLTIGFDLSGGLDSRVMASVARDYIDYTFTYDGNPPNGRQPIIAAQIANTLRLPNDRVDYGEGGAWARVLQDTIWATDGMKEWGHYHAIPFTWEKLPQQVNVMISASGQGELFGEDIEEQFLAKPPVDALLYKFQRYHPNIVRALVRDKTWTPRDSLQAVIASSEGRTNRERVLCAVYENFYPNFHFKGRPVRAVIEMINPLINCSLLDWIGAMPASLRATQYFNGKIRGWNSKLKLEIARHINNGIENVPCDGSYFSPKKPALLHVAGVCLSQYLISRFRHRSSGAKVWMREDSEFQTLIKEGLSALSYINEIDMDRVWEYWDSYQSGYKDFTPLFCKLSTVGLWLDRAQARFLSKT
ncbi:hypothetical protein ES707_15628 [subsurface metagenome]